jgi:polyhydroxyalkanoate synthesis regulator phasin
VTVADLTIADLASENAELNERASLADIYREMTKVAIEQLAAQNGEIEYLRRRVASLVDENRAQRGLVAA